MRGYLDGKVAMVTGAARGNDRAFAAGLAAEGASVVLVAEGASVVLVDRYDDAAAQASQAQIELLGGQALFARSDISRLDDVDAVLEQAAGHIGVPQDYVGLVNWLAYDESTYAIGAEFTVDGDGSTVMASPRPAHRISHESLTP